MLAINVTLMCNVPAAYQIGNVSLPVFSVHVVHRPDIHIEAVVKLIFPHECAVPQHPWSVLKHSRLVAHPANNYVNRRCHGVNLLSCATGWLRQRYYASGNSRIQSLDFPLTDMPSKGISFCMNPIIF